MSERPPKCNRCSNVLSPGEAIRDKAKSGYVHRDDCPPRKSRPSIGQTMKAKYGDTFGVRGA